MARVADSDVEDIIEVDSSLDLDAFIQTATTLVDSTLLSAGYSDDQLFEIERFLAAHFVAMRQRQTAKEGFGDATREYGGKFGLGLDFTQYGQQVKLLDYKGVLVGGAQKTIVVQAL